VPIFHLFWNAAKLAKQHMERKAKNTSAANSILVAIFNVDSSMSTSAGPAPISKGFRLINLVGDDEE
jgi:hypothetical protein